MSCLEGIGGYFSLEIAKGRSYYPDLLALNTCRNAFEYILLAKKYVKVYMPFYTCEVMLEPLAKHNIEVEFYKIDEKFEIVELPQLNINEALLYTNYFGVKDDYVEYLSGIVANLVIDNAQAFFSRPIKGVDTIYSPRKFFGLPDGGYLATDSFMNIHFEKDESLSRCSHLLLRLEYGAEAGYNEFKKNDHALTYQPIMSMSNLTYSLLEGIDYEYVSEVRKRNFNYLHQHIGPLNNIKWIDEAIATVPMIYPFFCERDGLREELIRNKIFIAAYWPNVLEGVKESDYEFKLVSKLLPLPIDQRYNLTDMRIIAEKIKGLL